MTQEIGVNPIYVCLDIVQNSIDLQAIIDYTKANYKKEVIWLNAQDLAEQSNRASKADNKGGSSKSKHDGIIKGLKSKIDSDLVKVLDSKKKSYAAFEKAKAAAAAGKSVKGKGHSDEPPKLELPFKGQIDVIYFILNFPYLPQQLQDSLEAGLDISIFLSLLPADGAIPTQINRSLRSSDKSHQDAKPSKKSSVFGSELDYTSHPEAYPPARWLALRPTASPNVLFTEINVVSNDAEATFHNIEDALIKSVSVRSSFTTFLSTRTLQITPISPIISNLDTKLMSDYLSEHTGDIINAILYQLIGSKNELQSISLPAPGEDLTQLFDSVKNDLNRKVIFTLPKEIPDPLFTHDQFPLLSLTLRPIKDWHVSPELSSSIIDTFTFLNNPINFFAYAGQRFEQLFTNANKKYNLQMPASFFDWTQWNYRADYESGNEVLRSALYSSSVVEPFLDEAGGVLWLLTLPPVARTQGQCLRWATSPPTIDSAYEFMTKLFDHENDPPEKRARGNLSPSLITNQIYSLIDNAKSKLQEELDAIQKATTSSEQKTNDGDSINISSSSQQLSLKQSGRGAPSNNNLKESDSFNQNSSKDTLRSNSGMSNSNLNSTQLPFVSQNQTSLSNDDKVKAKAQKELNEQIESLLSPLVTPIQTRYKEGSQLYRLPMDIGESVEYTSPYYFETGLRADIKRNLYNGQLDFGYTLYYKDFIEIYGNSDLVSIQLLEGIKLLNSKDGIVTILFNDQSIVYDGRQLIIKSVDMDPIIITQDGAFITCNNKSNQSLNYTTFPTNTNNNHPNPLATTSNESSLNLTSNQNSPQNNVGDRTIVYPNGDIGHFDGQRNVWTYVNAAGQSFEKGDPHENEVTNVQNEPSPDPKSKKLTTTTKTVEAVQSVQSLHGPEFQTTSPSNLTYHKKGQLYANQLLEGLISESKFLENNPESNIISEQDELQRFKSLKRPHASIIDYGTQIVSMIRPDHVEYYVNPNKSRRILLEMELTIEQNEDKFVYDIPTYPVIKKEADSFNIVIDRFNITLSPVFSSLKCDDYTIETRAGTTYITTPTDEMYFTVSRVEIKSGENHILVADSNGTEKLGDLQQSSASGSSASLTAKKKSKKVDFIRTRWGEMTPIKEALTEPQQLALTNKFLPRFFAVHSDMRVTEFLRPSTIDMTDRTELKSEINYPDGSQVNVTTLHHKEHPPLAYIVYENLNKAARSNILKGLHSSGKGKNKAKKNPEEEAKDIQQALDLTSSSNSDSKAFLESLNSHVDRKNEDFLESVKEPPPKEEEKLYLPPSTPPPKLLNMQHNSDQPRPPQQWRLENSEAVTFLKQTKREKILDERKSFNKNKEEVENELKDGKLSKQEARRRIQEEKSKFINNITFVKEEYQTDMEKLQERMESQRMESQVIKPPHNNNNKLSKKLFHNNLGANVDNIDDLNDLDIEDIQNLPNSPDVQDLPNSDDNSYRFANREVLGYWDCHESDFAMPLEEDHGSPRPVSRRVRLHDPPRNDKHEEPPKDVDIDLGPLIPQTVRTRASMPLPKSGQSRPRTISTEPALLNFGVVKAHTAISKPLVITNTGGSPLHFSFTQPNCPVVDGQPLVKVMGPTPISWKVFPGLRVTLKVALQPADPQYLSTVFSLKTSQGDMNIPIIAQIEE